MLNYVQHWQPNKVEDNNNFESGPHKDYPSQNWFNVVQWF